MGFDDTYGVSTNDYVDTNGSGYLSQEIRRALTRGVLDPNLGRLPRPHCETRHCRASMWDPLIWDLDDGSKEGCRNMPIMPMFGMGWTPREIPF